MAVLFSWEGGDADIWRSEMTKVLGPFDLRVFPEVGERSEIEYAMVWMHPVGDLKTYPNLRAIFSIGAGVEHILRDPELPHGVPIVRLVDDLLVQDMTCHVIHWVLHFHRSYHRYAVFQKASRWQRLRLTENGQRRVGILGLGQTGLSAARALRNLGFDVAGWSRSLKNFGSIACFAGVEGLGDLLARTDILVCLLPLTEETADLMNAARLALLPEGAFIINCGRGGIIVDADLIEALDEGRLEAAALDVFHEEPLPDSHPFWAHPKVYITPHAAASTNQRSGAACIARNIQRMEAGEAPFPILDRVRGY